MFDSPNFKKNLLPVLEKNKLELLPNYQHWVRSYVHSVAVNQNNVPYSSELNKIAEAKIGVVFPLISKENNDSVEFNLEMELTIKAGIQSRIIPIDENH